jgi:hypothetical protein
VKAVHLFLEPVFLPDEDQLDVKRAGRLNRAVHDGARRPVSPHAIQSNPRHELMG